MTVRDKTGTSGRGTARVPPPGSGPPPADDHLVLVSGSDSTPGFLGFKLVPGTGILLTLLNPGGFEQIEVALNPATLFPVADNVFSIKDDVDPTKFLNVQLSGQATGTTQTITTTATVSRPFRLPDISGTALVAEDVTGFVYIGGQTTQDHGSNARVQLQSNVANGSQYRSSQYGNNNASPGMSAFKSRGAAFPTLVGVLPGDPLWRVSAVGVTNNNTDIPIAAFITIQAPAGWVPPPPGPPATGWVPSELEVQLVPLAGPINSRRVVFKIGSEGDTQTLRGVRAGGFNTSPAALETGALITSASFGGAPNGIVTGSPGDIYLDQQFAGFTYGASVYIKATGVATNTGWLLISPNETTTNNFVAPLLNNSAPVGVRDATGVRLGDYVSIGKYGAFIVAAKAGNVLTITNDGHATQGFTFVPEPPGLQVLPCPKPQTRILAEFGVTLGIGGGINFGPFAMAAEERCFIEAILQDLNALAATQVMTEGFNVAGAVSYHRFINPGDALNTVRVHVQNNSAEVAAIQLQVIAQNL